MSKIRDGRVTITLYLQLTHIPQNYIVKYIKLLTVFSSQIYAKVNLTKNQTIYETRMYAISLVEIEIFRAH